MNNIIKLRKKANMTQLDLAKKCKTTQAAISRIENNEIYRVSALAKKIAAALNCNVEDLYTDKVDDEYADSAVAAAKYFQTDYFKNDVDTINTFVDSIFCNIKNKDYVIQSLLSLLIESGKSYKFVDPLIIDFDFYKKYLYDFLFYLRVRETEVTLDD